MTEPTFSQPEQPAPPAPQHAGRPTWVKVTAIVVAAAVGVVGAALVADNASADSEERVEPTPTARPVPVLATGPIGSSLSEALSQYAITAWSDPTRGLVLGAWGAAFTELLGGGEPPETPDDAVLVEDPRLTDPAGAPGFVDPCAPADGAADPEGCPAGGVPGEVLGEEPLGPNSVLVAAFPQPDVAIADECGFADVAADELPIAVITGNPGSVEVRVDDSVVAVTSDADEVEEWEAWRDAPEGARPAESFVAHCVAVPRPATTGPIHIIATAVDDAGQVVVADTMVLATLPTLPPATVTPLDGTMVRVDVPLPAAGTDATVRVVPAMNLDGTAAACDALPPPAPAAGWRHGATAVGGAPPVPGQRPYLDGAPLVQRTTVPLPEGEPSLLCIAITDGTGTHLTDALATPPDARRLQLAVTEVDVTEAIAAGDVVVRGTFAELGWTPCGVALPAVPAAGPVDPAPAGLLCTSGGDSGAIAAAGGVLDIDVTVEGTTTHTARIALSASPGGAAIESYRIPIPAAGLEGTLCTAGVDQPGCVAPEGANVVGTIVVTATWDEGPIGPASAWTIAPVPTLPDA